MLAFPAVKVITDKSAFLHLFTVVGPIKERCHHLHKPVPIPLAEKQTSKQKQKSSHGPNRWHNSLEKLTDSHRNEKSAVQYQDDVQDGTHPLRFFRPVPDVT